jgi:hypothetical protein
MNIKDAYSSEPQQTANDIVDISMNWIWDNIIAPNQDKLTEEDADMLVVIGQSLKIVGEQATAYTETFKESSYLNN